MESAIDNNKSAIRLNAAGILRAEIARKGIKLSELSIMLKDKEGIDISPSNISTKINRGKFSASFFLQVLSVLDCSKIDIK